MKIAIIGTRGIPNNHGGFEQFAEYFSTFLAKKGHEVYVYNSHDHPYQEKSFNGVKIIHCFDPEYTMGTAGQFIYDFNCIKDSRKRDFDVILQLGYTSNSVWHWYLPKRPVIITNMDGMEWKRSKYSKKVQKFLKHAEKLAVRNSDYLIADSVGIQTYLLKKYQKPSEFIAYGAKLFKNPQPKILKKFEVSEHRYHLIIARLEPENNIETIVDGFHNSKSKDKLIIFGALNDYGKRLQAKYSKDKRIQFLGANYNQEELDNLRYYSRYYFHGHSVGGTNPSLLEAMASKALIIAHNNVFNESILGDDAIYFEDANDVTEMLDKDDYFGMKWIYTDANCLKIEEHYNWELINSQYESFVLKCLTHANAKTGAL